MRLGYRARLGLVICGLTAVTSLLTTTMIHVVAVRAVRRVVGQKLLAIVACAAPQLDGDVFDQLRYRRQLDTPEYQRIASQLAALAATSAQYSHVRRLYTLRPASEGGYYTSVVDSAPPSSPDYSPLGEIDDLSASPEFRRLPTTPTINSRFTWHKRWGLTLTAAAPIRRADGEIVGLLALDSTLETVRSAVRQLDRISVGCLLFGLLVAVVSSTWLARYFSAPLRALIAGTRAVAGGELEHRVEITSTDELGELATSFNQMTAGLRERGLYARHLQRYVGQEVADRILADPDRRFWHGERRRVTILFVDIRNFTPLCNELEPELLLTRLNDFLAQLTEVVLGYGGVVDKFLGDGLMAVFGAPTSTGHDEEQAVRAALDLAAVCAALSEVWVGGGLPPLRIGVGVNTGDVVVGNLGSELRTEYSALGDAVNVASGLEQLNKLYGTTILLSATTRAVVADLVRTRFVADATVKGREEPVQVYELLGLAE